jgi:hypothetical protein
MTIFGWSYPAGCSSTPYDHDCPEECPHCGATNADEDGAPVFTVDPVFCSAACRDEYARTRREWDAIEGAALAQIEADEARWAIELADLVRRDADEDRS